MLFVASAVGLVAVDRIPFPVLGLQGADGYFENCDGWTRQQIAEYAASTDEEFTIIRKRDWRHFPIETISFSIVVSLLVLFVIWTMKSAVRRVVSPYVKYPWSYFLTFSALAFVCAAVLRLPLHLLAGLGVETPIFLRRMEIVLLLIIVYGALIFALIRLIPKLKIAAAQWCAGCGYDLRGIPGSRCPECGREAASLIFANQPAGTTAIEPSQRPLDTEA